MLQRIREFGLGKALGVGAIVALVLVLVGVLAYQTALRGTAKDANKPKEETTQSVVPTEEPTQNTPSPKVTDETGIKEKHFHKDDKDLYKPNPSYTPEKGVEVDNGEKDKEVSVEDASKGAFEGGAPNLGTEDPSVVKNISSRDKEGIKAMMTGINQPNNYFNEKNITKTCTGYSSKIVSCTVPKSDNLEVLYDISRQAPIAVSVPDGAEVSQEQQDEILAVVSMNGNPSMVRSMKYNGRLYNYLPAESR